MRMIEILGSRLHKFMGICVVALHNFLEVNWNSFLNNYSVCGILPLIRIKEVPLKDYCSRICMIKNRKE